MSDIITDTMARPFILRLGDTDAGLTPAGLGDADPFAGQRGIAWRGDAAMAVGRVAWAGGECAVAAYPHTELVIVQGGTLLVEAVTTAGVPSTLRLTAGQAAVLTHGAALRLRADGPVAWSFCAALAPAPISNAEPASPCLAIDPDAVLAPSLAPAAEVLLGPVPACRSNNLLHDPATGLRVGVWDSTPYVRRTVPHRVNELMHILDGAVTLTDETGAAFEVVAGDTVFVPRGTPCAWTSVVPVRKIYAVQDVPA